MSKEKKSGFFSRLGHRANEWTGAGIGLDAFRSINFPGKKMLDSNKQLYRDNIARETEFEKMDFDTVLYNWGISSTVELVDYKKAQNRGIWLGAFLFIFGFGGWCFQLGGHNALLSAVSGFACLSVALLGALYVVSSYWRLRCIEEKRFKPFIKWIKSFGSFD